MHPPGWINWTNFLTGPGFKRAQVPVQQPHGLDGSVSPLGSATAANGFSLHSFTHEPCLACGKSHARGFCPLKLAGIEHCALCGLAHYGSGHQRICPHLNSVTQCRVLLETIKQSNEPRELKDRAKKYVVGIIGDLNNRKKKAAAQALLAQQQQAPQADGQASASKGANGYSSPYQHVNGVGSGKEEKVGGAGGTSLASRDKQPRHHLGVREEFGDD